MVRIVFFRVVTLVKVCTIWTRVVGLRFVIGLLVISSGALRVSVWVTRMCVRLFFDSVAVGWRCRGLRLSVLTVWLIVFWLWWVLLRGTWFSVIRLLISIG